MKTIEDVRLDNLLILLERARAAKQNQRDFCAAVDTDPSYLSQIKNRTPDSKTGEPRTMGSALARKIELALGLTPGWMDQENSSHHQSVNPPLAFNGYPVSVSLRRINVIGTAAFTEMGVWPKSQRETEAGDALGTVMAVSNDVNAYAIRVRGDGLRPKCEDGEYLVVIPSAQASTGHNVVIRLKSGDWVARKLGARRETSIETFPINDLGRPMTYQLADVDAIHRIFWIGPYGELPE